MGYEPSFNASLEIMCNDASLATATRSCSGFRSAGGMRSPSPNQAPASGLVMGNTTEPAVVGNLVKLLLKGAPANNLFIR